MAKKTQIYKTDQDKNLMYALILLVLVIVLFLTLSYGIKNYPGPNTPTNKVENTYPEITSSDDLDRASAELDLTDLNGVDKELNSLDADSSSF